MNEFAPEPHEEAEARLTALLLGELTGAEAASLRQAIDADPQLAALYERLKQTTALVREASATPAQPAANPSTPLRLSEDRRQKLLTQFKTVRPKEFAAPEKSKHWSVTVLQVAAVFVAMLFLAGLFLPALAKAKYKSKNVIVLNNLKQIEIAKEMWAKDNDKSGDAAPTFKDIEPYLGRGPQGMPAVQGETYRLGKVSESPSAKLPGANGKVFVLAPQQLAHNDVTDLPANRSPRHATPLPVAAPAKAAGNQQQQIYLPPKSGGGSLRQQQELAVNSAQSAKDSENVADRLKTERRLGFGNSSVNNWQDGAQNKPGDANGGPKRDIAKLGIVNGYVAGNAVLNFRTGPDNSAAIVDPATGLPVPVASPPAAPSAGFAFKSETDSLPTNFAPPPAEYTGKDRQNLISGIQSNLENEMKAAELAANESLSRVDKAWQRLPSDQIQTNKQELAQLDKEPQLRMKLDAKKTATPDQNDAPLPRTVTPPPVPQPEILTGSNAFSTFSLNVADVSFKLAAASLEKGVLPEPASIRSEEFINAFDYRDPEAPPGVPIAFAWERARYPFAQNRDVLRFSLKTAATGREPGRPLNIVLLLDNSGSMERADRVAIIREALRVLAGQLQPQDTLSIVTFARTPHLFVDGVSGSQAADAVQKVSDLTPQGGTNLGEAMKLAYETALRHYQANGVNRVVLLTDGAANLGNVDPNALKQKVEAHRKQGVALDCFGIGWEGYNDDLLELLARNGDGRYGFLNSPEEAATGFAHQLAGALNVAAADVKVQVEFNPRRVTVWRQVGYAKLQLKKEDFRDNSVDAAEIGAAEAGNALYVLQVDANGEGPIGTVRVRYRKPGTQEFSEHEWAVPYNGNAVALEQSSSAMRLAVTASAFSEWLANSPYAAEVTPDVLLHDLSGVPETFAPDARPKKLEWMIRQAKSLK